MSSEITPLRGSLLIFGAGGQAANAFEASTAIGLEVVGFIDETVDPKIRSSYFDVPVFTSVSEATAAQHVQHLFVAIGEGWRRAKVTERVRREHRELTFASLIHPSAVVSTKATIGEGSLIMPGAFVGPGAAIGAGGMVGLNVVVAHHCLLGDYVSVFSSASIGGETQVGDRSAIGMNAAVREKTSIGCDVVIGAQSFIREDVGDQCVVVGVPGRTIRHRSVEEPYMLRAV